MRDNGLTAQELSSRYDNLFGAVAITTNLATMHGLACGNELCSKFPSKSLHYNYSSTLFFFAAPTIIIPYLQLQ